MTHSSASAIVTSWTRSVNITGRSRSTVIGLMGEVFAKYLRDAPVRLVDH
jgi:hypothetical protein